VSEQYAEHRDIGEDNYGSALAFGDNERFSEHLKSRSTNIQAAISDIFSRLPSLSPEAEDLRRQLNDALAREKLHVIQLRQALDEQDSLEHRLEEATKRYIKAEKALDRAKSSQVLKLERQAMSGANGDASPSTSKKGSTPIKTEHGEVNGELENGTSGAEAEAARREALAVAERQKAQVTEIEAENDRLTNELSAARTKLASLSDDDYKETSLFKILKSQHEDVIKRVNDLEATNTQLREEAQKLQGERMAYRRQVDEYSAEQINDMEAQIARTETDLARVRNNRDELMAELSIRKTAEENRRMSADQARELAAARDARIASLESEIERLRMKLGESAPPDSDLDALDNEALKIKLRELDSQHAMLSSELASMETAWRKSSALANKKVEEIHQQEETVARLSAEKAKADQKYFAAMKLKDARENELRTFKQQSTQSATTITHLKDAESKTRELATNLERQLAEAKENLTKLEAQHKSADQKAKESNLAAEGLKKQLDELKGMISSKDKEILAAGKAKREAEAELERMQTYYEDKKRQLEELKASSAASNSTSSDNWRVS
jgi:E3 ubiquitin-protein ligase BRE1